MHEALARQRRGNRYQELEPMAEKEGNPMERVASLAPSPEQQTANSEIGRLLEQAVEELPGRLPDDFRAARRGGNEH